MKRRGLVVVLPAIMLLSACGGGGDDVEATDGEINSPIADYLGFDAFGGDPEEAQAQFEEEERVRQDAIAACMKEQGFDYIAMDPSQFMSFGSTEEFEYGSDEWVAKYGFGITTQRWAQSQLGDGLVGYDDAAFNEEDQPVDPNQEIREALSPEEQQAYDTALYGDQSGFEIDETLSDEEQQAVFEEMTFEMGGCYNEAQSASNSLATKFYEEFETEISDMYERAQNDPRVVDYEAEVERCVADKGLEYPGQEEVFSMFDEQMIELDSMIVQPGADLSEEDFAAMTEEELNEVFNQPVEFTGEARTMLAELQAEEIALAQAVNDCDGGFEAQQQLYQDVIAEYEQEFLDENKARLDELKSA